MAAELHDLTVKELEAATRVLASATGDLFALAIRFERKGDQEAAYQIRQEENDISIVCGVLLRAIRNREKEDREREYLEKGKPAPEEEHEHVWEDIPGFVPGTKQSCACTAYRYPDPPAKAHVNVTEDGSTVVDVVRDGE